MWQEVRLGNYCNNMSKISRYNTCLDVLTTIARNIEDIKDKSTQEEPGEYLATYHDPHVRQALVRNIGAPRKLLEILANDPDAGIAAEARENPE